MAWWLEGATFRHFGWVRKPPKASFFFLDFLRFLEPKNKRKKQEKNRKKSEIIGKSRKNRNFGGDIYRSPPKTDISAEISEILFPA